MLLVIPGKGPGRPGRRGCRSGQPGASGSPPPTIRRVGAPRPVGDPPPERLVVGEAAVASSCRRSSAPRRRAAAPAPAGGPRPRRPSCRRRSAPHRSAAAARAFETPPRRGPGRRVPSRRVAGSRSTLTSVVESVSRSRRKTCCRRRHAFGAAPRPAGQVRFGAGDEDDLATVGAERDPPGGVRATAAA